MSRKICLSFTLMLSGACNLLPQKSSSSGQAVAPPVVGKTLYANVSDVNEPIDFATIDQFMFLNSGSTSLNLDTPVAQLVAWWSNLKGKEAPRPVFGGKGARGSLVVDTVVDDGLPGKISTGADVHSPLPASSSVDGFKSAASSTSVGSVDAPHLSTPVKTITGMEKYSLSAGAVGKIVLTGNYDLAKTVTEITSMQGTTLAIGSLEGASHIELFKALRDKSQLSKIGATLLKDFTLEAEGTINFGFNGNNTYFVTFAEDSKNAYHVTLKGNPQVVLVERVSIENLKFDGKLTAVSQGFFPVGSEDLSGQVTKFLQGNKITDQPVVVESVVEARGLVDVSGQPFKMLQVATTGEISQVFSIPFRESVIDGVIYRAFIDPSKSGARNLTDVTGSLTQLMGKLSDAQLLPLGTMKVGNVVGKIQGDAFVPLMELVNVKEEAGQIRLLSRVVGDTTQVLVSDPMNTALLSQIYSSIRKQGVIVSGSGLFFSDSRTVVLSITDEKGLKFNYEMTQVQKGKNPSLQIRTLPFDQAHLAEVKQARSQTAGDTLILALQSMVLRTSLGLKFKGTTEDFVDLVKRYKLVMESLNAPVVTSSVQGVFSQAEKTILQGLSSEFKLLENDVADLDALSKKGKISDNQYAYLSEKLSASMSAALIKLSKLDDTSTQFQTEYAGMSWAIPSK